MPHLPSRKFLARLHIENLVKLCKNTSGPINSGFPDASLYECPRGHAPRLNSVSPLCSCGVTVHVGRYFADSCDGIICRERRFILDPSTWGGCDDSVGSMVTCAAMTRHGRQQIAEIQPESEVSSQAPPLKATYTPE